jgi:hypothetical protein
VCEVEPEPGELGEAAEAPGCDDLALERSFLENVYAWRGRCFPCHFSDQELAAAEAPRWIDVEGNCDSASLATLRGIVTSGYVDVDEPEQSLLLRKPLSEEAGGVEHGGHDKFVGVDDPAYVSFLRFIQHYADCSG